MVSYTLDNSPEDFMGLTVDSALVTVAAEIDYEAKPLRRSMLIVEVVDTGASPPLTGEIIVRVKINLYRADKTYVSHSRFSCTEFC